MESRQISKKTSGQFKGQVAFETILIVGFIFLLLIPLLYVLFSRSVSIQDEFKTIETSRALSTLSSTITSVGVLGPNNSAIIEFTLPDNIESISIGTEDPREITAVLSTFLGDIHIVKVVPFDVKSMIGINDLKSGRSKIAVTYVESEGIITVEKI